jgi:hypothetical protein
MVAVLEVVPVAAYLEVPERPADAVDTAHEDKVGTVGHTADTGIHDHNVAVVVEVVISSFALARWEHPP